MNSTISHADLIRRRVLRIHAGFLFVITLVATLITLIGWSSGKGPYALWHEQQFAAVGLFQAYLLMFVVGVVLWLGSNMAGDLRKWDLIGLMGHIPPLAANLIFANLFTAYGFHTVSIASITLHLVWISVELFAFFYKGRSIPTSRQVAI